ISLALFSCQKAPSDKEATTGTRWCTQKINQWYQDQGGCLLGCNYTLDNAINQLECRHAATFDTVEMNRELGRSDMLGFNVVRVYLHNLLWKQDSIGFLNRIDQFLSIADRHGIGAMFVFFDGCWNPDPHLGKQPAPIPHLHNSGWVQSPGAEILSDTTQ